MMISIKEDIVEEMDGELLEHYTIKIQNRKHNQTKKHDRTSNGDDKCSCEVVTVTFKETTDFYPMHMRVPISTDDSDGCSSTIGREQ
ncbi:hypothetical protein SDJN02_24572, partial [Cucurbita argyrosperma subsp. argyrosperma]